MIRVLSNMFRNKVALGFSNGIVYFSSYSSNKLFFGNLLLLKSMVLI